MKRFVTVLAISIIVFFAIAVPAASKKTANTTVSESLSIERAKINDVYVIHFILDGLNKKTFDAALAEGRLPTVKSRFIDGGTQFTNAVSVFPSTSTTVYQSYVTGLLPGRAGIPHLERFDRQTLKPVSYLSVGGPKLLNADFFNFDALMNPDEQSIDPPSTIFEILKGHPTAAIYTAFFRGAAYIHPERAPIHALWSTYVSNNKEKVDVLAMRDVMDIYGEDFEEIPRYTLVGLYSSDVLGHEYGPSSEEVSNVLVQFDIFLRDFLSLLEQRGILDKTYIILSADHGMHESGDLFHFQRELEKKGVFVKPRNPRAKGYTLYAANRGVASSHIYVRHDGGFSPLTNPEVLRKHPTIDGDPIDLISLITGMEATDLLVVRAGESKARIFDRNGNFADTSCYNIDFVDYCSYKPGPSGNDPLNYSKSSMLNKLMDGRPHSGRSWLEASAAERYPDAVVGLTTIFNDGRAGDAFITTRERFGFRKVKSGNHGGATEDDMHVPLIISGPGIAHDSHFTARPSDLYPLVLEWFGLHDSDRNHDGVDPLEHAPATDPIREKLAALEELFDANPPLLKMLGVENFIREKVHKIVSPREFKELHKLAASESALRLARLKKLKALEKSGNLEIVQRMRKATQAALTRMEDISAVLSGRVP